MGEGEGRPGLPVGRSFRSLSTTTSISVPLPEPEISPGATHPQDANPAETMNFSLPVSRLEPGKCWFMGRKVSCSFLSFEVTEHRHGLLFVLSQYKLQLPQRCIIFDRFRFCSGTFPSDSIIPVASLLTNCMKYCSNNGYDPCADVRILFAGPFAAGTILCTCKL